LGVAEEYCRGVGYLTTEWFRETAAGMAGLVKNGGTARWIVGLDGILSPADVNALQNGYDARTDEEALADLITDQLNQVEETLEADTRNTVGWLVAEGIVDIKLAIMTEDDDAIYHDKLGIIVDGDGNRMSFHGSMNDTGRAFRNGEAYTVDCDWHGGRDQETVNRHQERFERLWNGEMDGVRTVSLPAAVEEGLLDFRTTDRPTYRPTTTDGGNGDIASGDSNTDPELNSEAETLREKIDLRGYQQEALEAWTANGHQGTIEMATGLGKTITAMAGIDRYADALDQDTLTVVAVPENYLGKQWKEELVDWGFDKPVMAYGSANPRWKEDLSELVTDTELGIVSPGIAITTHTSFHKDEFLNHVERAQVPCMLIVDEVHGVGTENRQTGLTADYAARMGLSATPERYMDPEGTNALKSYFGGTVYEYGLEEGIPEYLAPYEYHPIVIELTETEAEEYIAESQRLAAAIGSDDADETTVGRIAQQRADIEKTAVRKTAALRDILDGLDRQDGLIVFSHHEQMDAVKDCLRGADIKYHRYTQHESPSKREQLISSFSREGSGLDALVGINCLDEGVDVSSARTAILMASTGNPRQFVQRRGRVLRRHESKDRAHIYDLIVVPPRSHFDDLLDSEQSLLLKQLERHEEFARTAENDEEALATVADLHTALKE
jgi:superfamily II DNA or RNA helicase